MNFELVHNNINVLDMERSLEFYETALGYTPIRQKKAADGSFEIVFMKAGGSHVLELTWLRDKKEPYDLGDNEIHMAVETDDYDGAHNLHKRMGCICYENEAMGLYFISDPDGYWTEVLRKKH